MHTKLCSEKLKRAFKRPRHTSVDKTKMYPKEIGRECVDCIPVVSSGVEVTSSSICFAMKTLKKL
jgi:hypothetical protein